MKKIKFCLTTLESLYSFGLIDQVDSIFEFMHQELMNGNLIVFEKHNTLSENSNKIFITDTSELKQFENDFMKKNYPALNFLLNQKIRAKSILV
jgi:hypothetical protein